jgi:hypothetical protein
MQTVHGPNNAFECPDLRLGTRSGPRVASEGPIIGEFETMDEDKEYMRVLVAEGIGDIYLVNLERPQPELS